MNADVKMRSKVSLLFSILIVTYFYCQLLKLNNDSSNDFYEIGRSEGEEKVEKKEEKVEAKTIETTENPTTVTTKTTTKTSTTKTTTRTTTRENDEKFLIFDCNCDSNGWAQRSPLLIFHGPTSQSNFHY